MKYNHKAISPLLLIVLPWSIVLALYALKLTSNLVDFSVEVILLFSFFGALSLAGQILVSFSVKKKNSEIKLSKLKKYLKLVFFIWFFGTALEIFFSGGLPIFWAMQGSSKDYTNFGIPSVHGVMNALYFTLMSGVAVMYFCKKNYRTLLMLLLLLVWPMLMLGRGILLTALVQILTCYIFFNGISIVKALRVVFLAFVVVVVFGLIGNARGTTENPFQYLIVNGGEGLFNFLPSGFLWVYIYITSPMSNYLFNAGAIQPSWSFDYSAVNLFPSILRPSNLDRADSFNFVDEGLNVSTIFASSHSDFGYFGDIVLFSMLMAWAFFWYRKTLQSNIYILPYSMVACVLFFSIFYNLFLLYPYLFSTILQGYISKRCER